MTGVEEGTAKALPGAGSERRGFRSDIQGLRAIAVGLVLTTHAFPDFFGGGFVGVDVFFVISGYLITGLLWNELSRSGTVDLGRFYLRRAARLLPLALVVLLATATATATVLSPLLLDFVPRHIAASGLYVQNWALIAESSAYAARDQGASPLQHFWTLSVEEQFYLVLPILLIASWRRRGPRAAVAVLSIVTAISLGFALGWVPTNPAASYYNTFTRAWEFGMGGLAAVFAVRIGRFRGLAQAAGVVTILAVAVTANAETTTPGLSTVVLVSGTLLVLCAHGNRGSSRTPVDVVLASPQAQYVGGISYGLYLWHWPALMVVQELLPRGSALVGWLGLAVGFVLAAASYPFERWARRRISETGTTRLRTAGLAVTVTGLTAVASIATAVGLVRVAGTDPASPPVSSPSADSGQPSGPQARSCVGAAAMLPDADCDEPGEVSPDPASARQDMPREECKESLGGREVVTCEMGTGATRVALVGDSHAQRLIPAIEPLLDKNGWTVTTYLKSSCPFSATRPVDYASSCGDWNAAVIDELVEREYALVIVNSAAGVLYQAGDTGLSSDEAGAAGMVEHWNRLTRSGAEVVVIRDNPQPGFDRFDPPGCVLRDGPDECVAAEDTALRPDPQVAAAESAGDGVHLVDLSSFYCRDGGCPSVIGGVLVYRDGQHVHSAFAQTLAPFLDQKIKEAVGGR